jgi:hypothetical protein
VPLVLGGPWPLRTADEQEDEAEEQAFERQAAAPVKGPLGLLKFLIPVVVLVIMAVVAGSIVMGMQPDDPPASAPTTGAGKTTPTAPGKVVPPAKKK